MAQFNAHEADNYGGNGGGSFFGLRDDKDTAVVRFCYNTLEDIHGYSVHEVEVDGKKRYVNCLRNYNDPVDVCPLCANRYKLSARLFVQLYDVEADEVKVWDRGKNFFTKLSSLCSRYNPLVATEFEIERNGKRGDQKTTYETYALETDDTTLEDLPEVPELLGTLILDKTAEEMEYFLDNGVFEDDSEDGNEEATPRRGARNPERDRRTPTNRNTETARRTPSANRGQKGRQDKF
jgi:hypothetical protein